MSPEKLNLIRKRAKTLLLNAKTSDDLDELIADVVAEVAGIPCGRTPQVTWSQIRSMRRVRIWVPGEIGYITVSADDDS